MTRRQFGFTMFGALGAMLGQEAHAKKPATADLRRQLSEVYPYIVPNTWVRAVDYKGITYRKISNDVYAVLVRDLHGTVQSISHSEKEQFGKSDKDLFKLAEENLILAWEKQHFTAGFGVGFDGVRFGGAEGSWLAPSVLLSKRFYELATKHLKTNDVLVAIPNQERLIAFPNDNRSASSLQLADLVRKGFATHPKPVTKTILRLRPKRPPEAIDFTWLA